MEKIIKAKTSQITHSVFHLCEFNAISRAMYWLYVNEFNLSDALIDFSCFI